MSRAENIVTSIKVTINAPASVVWEVLTDLPRYHEWNTFCPRATSTFKLGDPIEMYIPLPDQPGKELHQVEYVVAFEPNQLLSWELPATSDNKDCARRDQYVETLGPEESSYYSTDIFLGLNQDKIMETFGAWVKSSFDIVALGVKKQAEKLHAERKLG